MLKGIIIKCNSEIQEERTMNAIYHLLTGKKSIQTMQDAHIYELNHFYGVFESLSKMHFDQMIQSLIEKQFIFPVSKGICKPTEKGLKWLDENQDKLQFSYFNGLTYHGIDDIFLERLLLFIQVLTNRKMNHSSFIPVIDKHSITTWMKIFYQKVKVDIDKYLRNTYQELTLVLHHFPEAEAEMFVNRLTGYQHYGMSADQLADRYKLSKEDVNLLFTAITHRILYLIQQTPNDYLLLTQMIADLRNEAFLTESAYKTYKLIRAEQTIDHIAQMRHLTVNTIYDHIVEISLYDKEFSIKPYVGKQEQIEIIKAIKETNNSKLKEIKDKVHRDITYFQIRLVLTVVKGDRYETI